jgi:hypothetical protein
MLQSPKLYFARQGTLCATSLTCMRGVRGYEKAVKALGKLQCKSERAGTIQGAIKQDCRHACSHDAICISLSQPGVCYRRGVAGACQTFIV